MKSHYKILLLGDSSNFHNALAYGLRARGHEVVLASAGSRWLDTNRDIDISRKYKNKLGGLELWLRINALIDSKLSGFDIVSITNDGFAELRPERMSQIFNRIVKKNKNVFLTILGTDPYYVRTCISDECPLKYTEWQINGKPSRLLGKSPELANQWLSPEIMKLYQSIYGTISGAVTALYEYEEISKMILGDEMVGYGGIPIITNDIVVHEIPREIDKVRIFLGRHAERQVEKGTDRLYEIAKRVQEKHNSKCELVLVENVPYVEYLDALDSAHVVIDQLYSYTPATNALLAMAKGKVVVSGGEPEYYNFINEKTLHPIINAEPDDDDKLFRTIESLVLNPSQLHGRGLMGREFVEKHNDVLVVADRFVEFWKKKIYGT